MQAVTDSAARRADRFSGIMAEKTSLVQTFWTRFRPKVLAILVDTFEYVLIWASILVMHFVKIAVAAAGVDADVIGKVSFMEKWVWLASFAMFFWRSVVRLWQTR